MTSLSLTRWLSQFFRLRRWSLSRSVSWMKPVSRRGNPSLKAFIRVEKPLARVMKGLCWGLTYWIRNKRLSSLRSSRRSLRTKLRVSKSFKKESGSWFLKIKLIKIKTLLNLEHSLKLLATGLMLLFWLKERYLSNQLYMVDLQTSLSLFWEIPGITSSIIKSLTVTLTLSFAMTRQKSIIIPCFTINASDIFILTMRKEALWVYQETFSWFLGVLNSRILAVTFMIWNVWKTLTVRAIIIISLSKILRSGVAILTRNPIKARPGPKSLVSWRKIHSINLFHHLTSLDRTLYLRLAKTWLYLR